VRGALVEKRHRTIFLVPRKMVRRLGEMIRSAEEAMDAERADDYIIQPSTHAKELAAKAPWAVAGRFDSAAGGTVAPRAIAVLTAGYGTERGLPGSGSPSVDPGQVLRPAQYGLRRSLAFRPGRTAVTPQSSRSLQTSGSDSSGEAIDVGRRS